MPGKRTTKPDPKTYEGDEELDLETGTLESVDPVDRAKYPNLAAQRDLDEARHLKRALEMGVDRKTARRHAAKDVRDGDVDRRED
jgi:hypothetical protein